MVAASSSSWASRRAASFRQPSRIRSCWTTSARPSIRSCERPPSPGRSRLRRALRLAAIGSASGNVCLSYSCRDTRQFRDTFPSWIVLQAFRLKAGDPSLTYADLEKRLPEPASAVPPAAAQALTDAGWWLANSKSANAARRAILSGLAVARTRHPRRGEARLRRLYRVRRLRQDRGSVLDPSRTGRHVSASTLEGAAECPLRFFMQQGLGVKPLEEGSLTPTPGSTRSRKEASCTSFTPA